MMSADQYRDALKQLKLTQGGSAVLMGLSEVTGRRWAADGVSGPPAILLWLLVSGKITVWDIEKFRDKE